MKNFLLGVLFAASCTSFALEWKEDGGAILAAEDVKNVEIKFDYLRQENFVLRNTVEELQARKCI